jgi:uncharacterized protein (TIGR00369 family)
MSMGRSWTGSTALALDDAYLDSHGRASLKISCRRSVSDETQHKSKPRAGLVDEVGPGLTGLAQLRALIASGRRPGILVTLDFQLVEVDLGRAVFAGTPGAAAYNPIGVVHGGYAATLLDSACGCAVHSRLTESQAYTTLELKVAYHKAMTTETGLVRAEGRVLSLGRRAAFAEAKLTDANGRLHASATSTLLILER